MDLIGRHYPVFASLSPKLFHVLGSPGNVGGQVLHHKVPLDFPPQLETVNVGIVHQQIIDFLVVELYVGTGHSCIRLDALVDLPYCVHYDSIFILVAFHAVGLARPCLSVRHYGHIKASYKFLHKPVNMEVLKHGRLGDICIMDHIDLKFFIVPSNFDQNCRRASLLH